ncbi:MAG: DUF4280 domain-containing protein [Dehalococcoidia bacterium]
MPPMVAMGANLQCIFGAAPSTLVVIPKGPPVMAENKPAATIMDFTPMANIPPFGMCMSPQNPQVIAATAAALGVFTPMPCIPVTTPWKPGAVQTKINNFPALTMGSTCQCAWGLINITNAGTTKEMAN